MAETPFSMGQGDGGAEAARWPAGASLGLLLAALVALVGLALARSAAARDPLRLAWQSARSAERYAFEGESAARIGERTTRQRMEGEGDLGGELRLRLLGGADGVRYRIAWPEAWALSAGEGGTTGAIDPHALALALPLGDPLALLAVGQAARPGPVESVGGRACRRVDFRVGGRAYGAWWLEHERFMPVNADSGGLHTFSAEATLWQDPRTHLPCRIRARTDLPRLGGAQPGSGEIDWRYSDWGLRR